MSDDSERVSVEEEETAAAIRTAAERLDAAHSDLERAIDESELGATAGVTAAYRAELGGLASRMNLFASELVEDDE